MNLFLQAKNWSVGIFAIITGIFIFLFPQQALTGVQDGLNRCYTTIIPALFPFFILADLFLQSPFSKITGWLLFPVTYLLKIPKEQSGIIVTGWIGGFAAAGASIGYQCKSGQLSSQQAQKLLVVSCAAGPSFVIAAVGYAMLQNLTIGIFLFFSQLIACVVSGWVISICFPSESVATTNTIANPCSFAEILSRGVSSTLTVCGYVVFFQFLYQLIPANTFSWSIACLLEMSLGCSESYQMTPFAPFAAATCISLLGLCGFFQLASLTQKQFSLFPLLFSRLIHLPTILICLYGFLRFFPNASNVWVNHTEKLILPLRMPADAALIFFLFALAVFCSCRFPLLKTRIKP